jgi:hypothetical protein
MQRRIVGLGKDVEFVVIFLRHNRSVCLERVNKSAENLSDIRSASMDSNPKMKQDCKPRGATVTIPL